MKIVLRNRGIVMGSVGRTWWLLVGNSGRITTVTILLALPGGMAILLAGEDPGAWIWRAPRGGTHDPVSSIGVASWLLLLPLLIGSIMGIVAGSYTGERVSVAASLRLALRKFVPLVLYGLLLLLVVFLFAVLALAISDLMQDPPGIESLALPVLVFSALLFLCRYFVGVPAIVVEDLGFRDGFSRSLTLTRDRLWSLLGYQLLLGFSMLGVLVLWLFLMGWMRRAVGESGLGWVSAAGFVWIQGILIGILMVAFLLLFVIAPVVMYFQLRFVKEQFRLVSIADLVDRIGDRQRPAMPDRSLPSD